MSVGYPARWITVSTDASSPAEFTHIWTEAEAPPGSGNWVPLDTARFDSQFGIEPPVYFRKRAWSAVDNSYEDLSGTGRPRFLSGYATLGQDINWTPIVGQTISEIPTIIAATSGQGSATSPYATYSSPYSSFATPYTPGYGVGPAGYTATAPVAAPLFGGLTMSPTTLMLIVGGVLLFTLGRRGGK